MKTHVFGKVKWLELAGSEPGGTGREQDVKGLCAHRRASSLGLAGQEVCSFEN